MGTRKRVILKVNTQDTIRFVLVENTLKTYLSLLFKYLMQKGNCCYKHVYLCKLIYLFRIRQMGYHIFEGWIEDASS